MVEALLSEARGDRVRLAAVEKIWGRDHVLRVQLDAGGSAVVKRARPTEPERRQHGFGVELAALQYLSSMPMAIAPRLLGADLKSGVLVMEELPPGGSLADSLLTGDEGGVEADLIAYARALGSIHVWSMARVDELSQLRAVYAPGAETRPGWVGALDKAKEPFLDTAWRLGLAVNGVVEEIDQLGPILTDDSYLGFVHGDACPDNVRLFQGTCRIFDFETSSLGSVVLDAAYLSAPFPSCWCFARLPAELISAADQAYRTCLESAGVTLGPDWDVAMAAALGCWVVARGEAMATALNEDREWGTTTIRPRLLMWLANFRDSAGASEAFPRLRALASALHDQLARRWPGLVVPEYPALAGQRAAVAHIPEWWQPGL